MKTKTISRRALALSLAAIILAFATGMSTAPSSPERRAVEFTYLKSNPGEREQLKTFIVLNWFAMDKIAKEQGLMSAYTVMDTGTDEGPWNVVVSVTYKNEKGYDGIKEAFEKIRRAHTTIRVGGKGLRELGSIVETKRMFETPAN